MLTNEHSTNESNRLRNLFKYLAATAAATGHTANDIDNVSTYDPATARLSTDPILNALAQLACLKVGTNRAFISLIDEEYQNVVAEATSSISLFDTSNHGPDGGLSVGSRILDLHAGVCAGTMPAFLQQGKEPYVDTDNIYADRFRYVIRDFRKEDKYRDRPYVVGFPYMRFYAEVPIISSQGYVIGTLAAIDNAPRDVLSEQHYHDLTEIARTIMRHIELTMVDQHHRRAAKLLQGLNDYVQADETQRSGHAELLFGNEHFGHVKNTSSDDQQDLPLSLPTPLSPRVPSVGPLAECKSPPVQPGSAEKDSISTLHHSQAPLKNAVEEASSKVLGANGAMNQELGNHSENLLISQDIQASFQSASRILLEATGLEGVIYLDASTSQFASQNVVRASASTSHHWTGSSQHVESDSYDDDTHHTVSFTVEDSSNTCQTQPPTSNGNAMDPVDIMQHLEKSVLLASSPDSTSESTTGGSSVLPKIVHQSLLERYSKGHVFDLSQTEGNSPSLSALGTRLQRLSQCDEKQTLRPLSRRYLVAAIRWTFPRAQSVIFMPIWSPSKHGWLAGCLGWTSQRKRVLQQEELSYFSVFSNCLAADVARIELTVSDKAKSDFISSISHEIRSPLHGILGSAELARQNSDNVEQIKFLEMIEKCGETLLDTMEHILEYAKISTAATSRKSVDSEHASKVVKSSSIFDLGEIVEDTVGAVLAGHLHNTSASGSGGSHGAGFGSPVRLDHLKVPGGESSSLISIVMDVQPRASWQVESSIAAWRRIVLNVFGNALKYTEKGLIQISLEIEDVSETIYGHNYNATASLIIRDTGRGIGKHFLQNHLFTPFIQEDNLAAGTGLGLSIIKRIVQDLYGEVTVQSEIGIGTQVKVTMPVNMTPTPQLDFEPQPRGRITIAGVHSSPDVELASTEQMAFETKASAAISHALQQAAKRCHLELVVGFKNSQTPADVIAISDSHLQTMYITQPDGSKALEIPSGSSLLVLSAIAGPIGSSHLPIQPRIGRVASPIGPRQLAAAIDTLLAVDRTGISRVPEQSGLTLTNPSRSIHLPEATNVAKSFPTLSRARLLLVDDNDINIKLLSAMARKLSCDYETASNGQAALDLFKAASNTFDYVLMDLSMPVMDGFAAARAMREWERDEKCSATPIIAFTGLSSASAQQYALTSGIDLFMTKPVSMSKIEALIEGGVSAIRGF